MPPSRFPHDRSGRDRLLALCDSFFDYLARGVFPGGCFFVATALDPARLRGAVRELLIDEQREWMELLEEQAREAQAQGEVRTDITARGMAFDIGSILAGANINYVLLGEDWYLEQGRTAVRRCVTATSDPQVVGVLSW